MKIKFKELALATFVWCSQAGAGSVAGTGGSTEVTQLLNNVQLVQSYEQQVMGYLRQGLQYQAQLKNLINNPASLLGTDVQELIRGVGSIMSAGKAIGGTLAEVDKKFADTFKSNLAGSFAERFLRVNQASTDTLQAALKSAGMHRDQFKTDTDALQALYNQSQSTSGTLDSLQTLAQINIKQIQQTQALGDLLAAQNLAASTYMAAQNYKGQAALDNDAAIQKGLMDAKSAVPGLDTSTKKYKKWNLY